MASFFHGRWWASKDYSGILPSSGLISCDELSRDSIIKMMELAELCKQKLRNRRSRLFTLGALRGKVVSLYFQEPSTRTCSSFEVAAKRLGGQVMKLTENSSVKKGESLEDTCRMLGSYSDCVILRHPTQGAAKSASAVISVPLINAGDGNGEHPTQALLDFMTISKYFPRLTVSNSKNLEAAVKVVVVGDLKYGRTASSLGALLGNFNTVVTFMAPPGLELEDWARKFVQSSFKRNGYKDDRVRSVSLEPDETVNPFEQILGEADVVYYTRIQKERCPDELTHKASVDSYRMTKERLSKLKPNTRVLHPLPRTDELPEDFDDHPAMTFFEQAQNGLYVRMAILVSLCANR